MFSTVSNKMVAAVVLLVAIWGAVKIGQKVSESLYRTATRLEEKIK